jgi:hypothetical protein
LCKVGFCMMLPKLPASSRPGRQASRVCYSGDSSKPSKEDEQMKIDWAYLRKG